MNKITKFFDDIDLSKKYPNYFNKKLLRCAFLICFVLLGVAVYFNGSFQYFYSICQEDTCINPLYVCDNGFCLKGSACYDVKYSQYCTSPMMNRGDKIGNKNIFFEYFNEFTILIITFAFIINHLLYKRKYGKTNNN